MNEPLTIQEAPASYLVMLDSQRVSQGYKQTEVGVIPEDWDVVKLGNIGECLIGLTYKPSNIKADGTLVLRSSNVQDSLLSFDDNVYVDADIPQQIRVIDGDILVCVRNGSRTLIGKCALLDKRVVGQTFGAFMSVYRTASSAYIFQQFQSALIKRQITENIGATINQITNRNLNSFKVPFPTDDKEREAITTALSDVDALLAAQDRFIAKKRDIKQATMQQLLTGKQRLPGFTGEWGVKTLGDLFTFSGGYSASREQLSIEGHCYLHYGDIHGSSKTSIDTQVDFQDIPKLNIPLKQVSTKSLLKDGDVVFVDASEDDAGTSKHVVVVNRYNLPFISGLHTIVAKSKTDELSYEYRHYCFQTLAIRQQFLFYAVGTKVSGINKTNISKLTLPIPAVPEQIAIATVLSDIDAELAALEQQRDKTHALKQGMMQQLLTGKTRLI